MNGTLYIVATPIGNLEDITLRAVRILGIVDGIAAEDTRHTLKLLNHLGIRKPLLSLHEHNEIDRIALVAEKLQRGESWALVSDAGTPGLCDPGAQLVAALRKQGYPCVPIAGVSALATALSVSGLVESRFHFEGFLPSHGSARTKRLEALKALFDPIVLYEAPHRFKSTLKALFASLGERDITVFRELTKLHEEVFDSTLGNALLNADNARGEYVLLIHAKKAEAPVTDEEILAHLSAMIQNGMPKKQAVVQTAEDLRVGKNRVYPLSLDARK